MTTVIRVQQEILQAGKIERPGDLEDPVVISFKSLKVLLDSGNVLKLFTFSQRVGSQSGECK